MRSAKDLIYLTSGTIIALDIPASIYLLSLVYVSISRLKAKGVALWLLVGLSVSLTPYAIMSVFVLAYSKNLIEASSSELIGAYESFKRTEITFGVVILITLLCSYVVHWVFSMMYWTLACKLELAKNAENPDKHNSQQTILLISGLVLNIVAAFVQATPTVIYSS